MRNFTYRSIDERENLEAVLRRRKRKLNRQQIMAGCILAVIVTLLSLYVGRKILYTEFDGYIHADVNRIRAPYDMYIDSVYVSPGMTINKGDTLFSYHVLDWLVMDANPNDEPEINSRRRSLILRYTAASQQIGVLNVRTAELEKQIEIDRHNILFGLSDNAHKLDLERALSEAEAQKKALRNEMGVIARMMRETGSGKSGGTHNKGMEQIYENPGAEAPAESRRYSIAGEDAIVINVLAPDHMVFFEQEDLILFQHFNLEANNLQVLAYVPVDKAHRIYDGMEAVIVVSDGLSFNAHVVTKAVRSELVPEHLRSFFNKQNTSLIAILKIDENQVIPFWSAASGLPVKIRMRNFNMGEEKTGRDGELRYEVGRGILVDGDGKVYPDSLAPAAEVHGDTVPAATVNNPETATVDNPTAVTGRFRIIVDVFRLEENADRRVERLRSDGESGSGKMYRSRQWYVYISSHPDSESALKKLDELRSSSRAYQEAWILDADKRRKK